MLNRNNSLAAVDLASSRVTAEIPVGNAPHGILVAGNLAYVTNLGGRRASGSDFTNDSSGTPIVASRRSGHAITGTVSVVDLRLAREIKSIDVGLHPTAMALDDRRLFVANSNSDTVSVIDTDELRVVRTIAVNPFPGAMLRLLAERIGDPSTGISWSAWAARTPSASSRSTTANGPAEAWPA